MPSFHHRSQEKELLDNPNVPAPDLVRNMQELHIINSRLGGHRVSQKGLDSFLTGGRKTISVAEIGCGGGDNLRVLQRYCQRRGIEFYGTGIDISTAILDYAKASKANSGLQFLCSDYRSVVFPALPDVLFSSLFCHHFSDDQLVVMLRWNWENCRLGFFINDLHRHPLAYHSIKVLTALFSRSHLVKHDAPLSVHRGFVQRDWERLLEKAGILKYRIEWHWAFRWLIIVHKT